MDEKKSTKPTKKRKKLTIIVVACVVVLALVIALVAAASGKDSPAGVYSAYYADERYISEYARTIAAYTMKPYAGEELVFPVQDSAPAGMLTSDTKGYPDAASVLDLGAKEQVELTFSVPQDGVYALSMDYYSYDESILPAEFSMVLDGMDGLNGNPEPPFERMRSVQLPTRWTPSPEKATDRYGDEVVTIPNKVFAWMNAYLSDSGNRYSEPMLLELAAGTHTVNLTVKSGSFLLGAIRLSAPTSVPAYPGPQTASGNAKTIEIEGEDYSATNDSSIHAVVEYDSAVTPYQVDSTVLNTLDSDAFDSAGQMVEYTFDVEKDGLYYIALNYRQSDKTDFPVFVDVRVDGEIPNTAFQHYGMAYSTKYRQHTLADRDAKPLAVHLTAGRHTVSFTLTIDPISYILEEVEEIMSGVNDLALEITKVAGNNSDRYRDLTLSRYIPGLEEKLFGYADSLQALEESALRFAPGKDNVAVMASLLIASEQLRSLAENPDEIPYRIAELSSSTNSVNQYLANTVDSLLECGLAIDRVWIYQEDSKLPSMPGAFSSGFMQVKRFFSSFGDQSYSTSNTDKSHLQVWVNRPSQYVQIMQKMIDEQFTPKTGIEVDISIMPDQYKLVLANSSGNTPDVATGINYTVPYELAIRGALADMTQFTDFQEVASVYEPGFFLTGTIGDQVFSMPETMNFWVLIYRTDVMTKLGLKIPDTMDDVVNMLPELQMRGLNFYYPTAGMIAMRNFHGTTPLIVQHGGSMYYGTAQEGTALGEETSVDGFTTLTDLFTVYDMPVNVDNFYQHFRNGDLPIGITDLGTYNMINNAAPELEGSWTIAPVPGTPIYNADGELLKIDRSTCGCAESTVIFKSDAQREAMAWEFIKWWSSTEVQADFGITLQVTYGDEYLWNTANVEAFSQLPLDADHKEVVQEFAKNVVDVARVPGTYMLEREMSNAFNSIVVDGENAQTRIDEAVKIINREIKRKLEEFGFTDSEGNVLEFYNIPTIESVKKILGRA